MLNSIVAVYGNGVAASTNSYESIATVTVGAGGTATASFTSIPSTYQHLQIRAFARTAAATTDDRIVGTFNSDTAANYTFHQTYWEGSSANTQGTGGETNISRLGYMPGSSSTANTFGVSIIDILDYANTNKFKTVRFLNGHDENAATRYNAYGSGLWRSTAAITRIDLVAATAGNWAQYSSFALYGIKG